jgi:hypothetical protein
MCFRQFGKRFDAKDGKEVRAQNARPKGSQIQPMFPHKYKEGDEVATNFWFSAQGQLTEKSVKFVPVQPRPRPPSGKRPREERVAEEDVEEPADASFSQWRAWKFTKCLWQGLTYDAAEQAATAAQLPRMKRRRHGYKSDFKSL